VLSPGDAGYDLARRVWNAAIDKHPALIVRCLDARDVIAAVTIARETGLTVAVRSGGHNVAGRSVCDGGIVIDLSSMKGIRVDPSERIAQAQAGLRLGEFDRETQAFGLATTLGAASDTGITGLTLGGGYGWLNGRFGLACDNVRSLDIVTADGELLRANATQQEDLFWAMRGAGENFGVVTSLEYELHPIATVLAGTIFFHLRDGRQVLRIFDEVSQASDDALSLVGLVLTAPNGTPAVGVAVCHSGDPSDAEAAVAPFRACARPIADFIARRTYVEAQSLFDGPFAPGQHNYWKTGLVRTLTEAAIEVLLEYGQTRPTASCVIYLQQMHGAAARVATTATAFPHRFHHYDCGPFAVWQDAADSDRCVAWARACWGALRQFYDSDRVYVNALSDDVADRVKAAYGLNYGRLVELKKRYDPTNFFRLNANITPMSSEAFDTSPDSAAIRDTL
jgi:FAD/FMN-containing dehydrogenase